MSYPRTLIRLRTELGMLEASAERAGVALACAFSCSEEFEAAVVRAQRARGAFDPWYIAPMRFVVGATAVGALVAFFAFLS